MKTIVGLCFVLVAFIFTRACLCFVLVAFIFTRAYALECYQCNQVNDAKTCNTSRTCNAGETCFTNAVPIHEGVQYDMGCVGHSKCGNLTNSMSLVGRRELECHECCSRDHCNQALCQEIKSSTCEDDLDEDCAKLDSIFQICNDVTRARLICPRYCNLCAVVDGLWSDWTMWSACDVTCANGTQTRERLCNSPAPSQNGDQCKGAAHEIQDCINRRCPVHGVWTSWSVLGSCSVTCDIGEQQRGRSCSNPSPSADGDYCHGDARDNVICFRSPCANGNWSTWSTWSQCSVTCGTGLQKRQRECDNPKPSLLGTYCTGSAEDVTTCFDKACHGDGLWSDWTMWSACDVTCANGTQTRERLCNSPAPSQNGDQCKGAAHEIQDCINRRCPESLVTPNVVFKARTVTDISIITGQTLVFNTTIYNFGNGYNHAKGIFTAPLNGTYLFTVQLCLKTGHHFTLAIVRDNSIITTGHLYNGSYKTCHTFDGMLVLTAGQKVWVKCLYSPQNGDDIYEHSSSTENQWNTFSGMLIHQ